MSKIAHIDVRNGGIIVNGALAKLEAYAAELGLSVAQEGRWSYDRNGKFLNLKVQFVVGGEEGKAEMAEADFDRTAKWFGMPAGLYGTEITVGRRKYVLENINTRSRKYPLECKAVDGGRGIRLSRLHMDNITAGKRVF